MGLASSSAVRIDDAYGSLGGAFGGGSRALKKKPVLVLDPEELAKAHQLFQIGAAEQLGDFDPKERAPRPVTPLFAPVLGTATFHDDDEDEYIAPVDLAVDLSDEEEAEDDLPPIDLDALLALTGTERDEEAHFLPEPDLAADVFAEPAAEALEFLPEAEPNPAKETIVPADALARIIARSATQPKPVLAEPDPEPEVVVEPEAVPEVAELEPVWLEPAAVDDDLPILAPEPVAEEELLDLHPHEEFDGEAFVRPDAPLRVLPLLEDYAPRSQLRARLVREDLSLARPEPGMWQRLRIALRRWWNTMPF